MLGALLYTHALAKQMLLATNAIGKQMLLAAIEQQMLLATSAKGNDGATNANWQHACVHACIMQSHDHGLAIIYLEYVYRIWLASNVYST